jgi:MscS family membrane protein
MELNQLLETLDQLIGDLGWGSLVFGIVFLTLIIDLVKNRVFRYLAKHAARSSNGLDDALVYASSKPSRLLIWVLGLTLAMGVVTRELELDWFGFIQPGVLVSIVFSIAWFLIRLIRGIEDHVIQKQIDSGQGMDRTTVDALGKLARISVVITAILVTLPTLGINIAGVLTFGGVGGLAVGLAARDLLANFFGGLTVYMDRPFSVGDWVRSPDREIEGTVEKIGWRQTCIRTFDKRPLYVPNATFSTITVENPSRMTHRRIFETIGVRYDDAEALAPMLREVEAMVVEHEELDESQTTMVYFNRFADSSLEFFVYCFTKTTNWSEYHRVKQNVLIRIHEIIAKYNAEVAFPTRTLHVPEAVSTVQHQEQRQALADAAAGKASERKSSRSHSEPYGDEASE